MIIPEKYRLMKEEEIIDRIKNIKEKMGRNLIILGHHYQRPEIVFLSDYRGDSFGLSKKAAEQKEAEFIVFCGVHFMAESADILTDDRQIVHHPNLDSGCPMANMAEIDEVEYAWKQITSICGQKNIIPITYMNSKAALKAFCGRHGGCVCTSTNAMAVFQWAYTQREKVFFFPDEHLGRNTAKKIGISREEIILWDPEKELGGNKKEDIMRARLILWKGYCHVHTYFKTRHIREMRTKFPDAMIVVHPECIEEVVDMSDANGSTDFIVRYVNQAPEGSTVIIGTELNLIRRLAMENPKKKVFELARSLCGNMFKITIAHLLWTLENLGRLNIINVPEQIKMDARIALDRMLRTI